MKRLFCAGVLMIAGVYSAGAMADGCPTINGPNPVVITPVSPQSYTGPQDGIPQGQIIGNGFSGDITVGGYFQSCDGDSMQSSATPVKPPVSGVKYNDGAADYDVFDSGVPGIGYAVGIKDHLASAPYIPMLYPTTITQNFGGVMVILPVVLKLESYLLLRGI